MEAFITSLKQAGVPIYINLVVSVFVVSIIFERVFYLYYKYELNAEAFIRFIMTLLKKNEITKAIQYCDTTKSPLAKVFKAGLVNANRGDFEISTGIEEERQRVVPLLEKRIAALWSLANIATLIGLLGTIFGLIRSFRALAAVSPEQKASFLSQGISEAMNNTAVGLTIAIICMVGHLLLSGKSRKMVGDLEVGANAIENFLIISRKNSPK